MDENRNRNGFTQASRRVLEFGKKNGTELRRMAPDKEYQQQQQPKSGA